MKEFRDSRLNLGFIRETLRGWSFLSGLGRVVEAGLPRPIFDAVEDTLRWAEVDLGALADNITYLRAQLGREELILVAKADGYGHGAVTVARAAQQQGVERVAVATFREAQELRKAGIHARILVLGPFLEDEAAFGLPHGVEFTLPSKEHAHVLERAARARAIPARCHLKLDTGLNRLGMRPEEAMELLEELRGSRFLQWSGCMTHLARGTGKDAPQVRQQLRRFDRFVEQARARNHLREADLHVANSAGVLSGVSGRYDACRVGIAAYGVAPHPNFESEALRPVLSVRTRVVQFKDVAPGERVGYEGTFTARRPTRLAILPLGYADGMPWSAENRGFVLVGGRRAPLAGRISMDLTTIDVTGIDDLRLGDEVTLLGASGTERIRAEEIAETLGTIPYTLLCSLGKRVRRIVVPVDVERDPASAVESPALWG